MFQRTTWCTTWQNLTTFGQVDRRERGHQFGVAVLFHDSTVQRWQLGIMGEDVGEAYVFIGRVWWVEEWKEGGIRMRNALIHVLNVDFLSFECMG
jgi:hypothetical protein